MSIFWRFLTVGFLFPFLLLAQSTQKLQQFEELFISFRANRGDVLFPEVFQKLREKLEKIRHREQKSPDQTVPMQQINRTFTELSQWIKYASAAQGFLSSILQARDVALQAGSEDFAEQTFRKAEEKLQQAAKEFIKGNETSATRKASEAQQLYRQAESEAIRNSLLGKVHILIQESADLNAEKYAPRTYALTRQLLREVEKILEKNPYSNPELGLKADQLAEEAQHLLFIVQKIDAFYKEKGNLESFILELEKEIQSLGKLIGYEPKFYDGLNRVFVDLRAALENLIEENQQLRQKNLQLEEENRRMKKELEKYQEKIESKQALHERIARATRQFEESEVEIEYNGNLLVIRCNNFRFDPGRYEIPPKYGLLLGKVVETLKEFPKNRYIIKVMQYVPGNPLYNQNLALKRAESIKAYLQAHAFLEDRQIKVIGEALPVESGNNHLHSIVEFMVLLNERIP